jgi:hypothetical protein
MYWHKPIYICTGYCLSDYHDTVISFRWKIVLFFSRQICYILSTSLSALFMKYNSKVASSRYRTNLEHICLKLKTDMAGTTGASFTRAIDSGLSPLAYLEINESTSYIPRGCRKGAGSYRSKCRGWQIICKVRSQHYAVEGLA